MSPARKAAVLLLCACLGLAAWGCGAKTQDPRLLPSEQRLAGMYEACQTITVSDPAGERPPIICDELREYPLIDVATTLKRSNGMRIQGTWSGARLSEVLAAVGITEPFSELRLTAWDGYVAKVSYDLAMRPDTVFAYLQDGQPLPQEDGPVRLVVGSQDGFYWVRMIVSMEVVP